MSSQQISHKYASYFKKDSVVLFTTDTVVGLGCRFDSSKAIERIRQAKGIDADKPLAVLISNFSQLDELNVTQSSLSRLLIEKFWPGALTIVLTSEKNYPCSGEGNSIGLRMPDLDILRETIDLVGVPLAATSANLHGQPAPVVIKEVDKRFKRVADHTIDLNIKPVGLPSTVVKVEGGMVRVLREGSITRDDIAGIVGDRI